MTKVLWFRAEAKVTRWYEEVRLLEAEIDRAKLYFQYFADAWTAAIDDDPTTLLAYASNAYCYKMAAMYKQSLSWSFQLTLFPWGLLTRKQGQFEGKI